MEQLRKTLLDFADHLNTYKGFEEVRFDFMVVDYLDTLSNSHKPVVSGLLCPRCNSSDILKADKENDNQCKDCNFVWG
jgi:hypothetical protein